MDIFITLIVDLKLLDIPTINGISTWNNQRGRAHQIASRLDIFFFSEDLISKDIFFKASIMPCLGSYHWSILLEMNLTFGDYNQPFKFKSFWL